MTLESRLILVNKNTYVTAGIVSDELKQALRYLASSGKTNSILLNFLDDMHSKGYWILCDCLSDHIPRREQPALTVVRTAGKLHLRNIANKIRKNHADSCPFDYEPSTHSSNGIGHQTKPADLKNKLLNLHLAPAEGVSASKAQLSVSNGNKGRRKYYPKLGQLLIELMNESEMLEMDSGFNFGVALNKVDDLSSQYLVCADTSLKDVLCLSVKNEKFLIDKITRMREKNKNVYGVLIAIIHEIHTDKNSSKIKLIRFSSDHKNIDWECSPQGLTTVWSRRSITKGPFLAAITYATNAGCDEVVPQRVFSLPVLSRNVPLPVESHLERQVAGELIKTMASIKQKDDIALTITKPMYDIETDGGTCRPDYIIKGLSRPVVVEVMGMMDSEEYRERKKRKVPIMKCLGDVVEIAPAPNSELFTAQELSTLSNRVRLRCK